VGPEVATVASVVRCGMIVAEGRSWAPPARLDLVSRGHSRQTPARVERVSRGHSRQTLARVDLVSRGHSRPMSMSAQGRRHDRRTENRHKTTVQPRLSAPGVSPGVASGVAPGVSAGVAEGVDPGLASVLASGVPSSVAPGAPVVAWLCVAPGLLPLYPLSPLCRCLQVSYRSFSTPSLYKRPAERPPKSGLSKTSNICRWSQISFPNMGKWQLPKLEVFSL
jgi:hypothetical protein